MAVALVLVQAALGSRPNRTVLRGSVIGGIAFGRMMRQMMRAFDAPMERAARTYSSSPKKRVRKRASVATAMSDSLPNSHESSLFPEKIRALGIGFSSIF